MKSKVLDGKVALVTGCNRGIGRTILELFAKEGATVYACARNNNSFDDYCAELASTHSVDIYPFYLDVTKADQVRQLFTFVQLKSKKIDILVNNAGIMKDSLIGMISNSTLEEVFSTNVYAPINFIQYASKLMKREGGSIINISSIVGLKGVRGQLVYSASKGALNTLTLSASKELAPYKIRVNAVSPGMIKTDMTGSLTEEILINQQKKIALGRLGTTQEVAETVLFLASDYSVYITGQILGVDGGFVI